MFQGLFNVSSCGYPAEHLVHHDAVRPSAGFIQLQVIVQGGRRPFSASGHPGVR
ncbi:MAG: hypothetical protein MZV63_11755 [Marinilabiliales bacterium]|nr:hypothetical protein [Marinilabiliales bacterium]